MMDEEFIEDVLTMESNGEHYRELNGGDDE
jgi:hypothetical protein